MILTTDIGNTTMTIGLFTPEGKLEFRGSLKTDKNKTRDQIAIDFLDMFRLNGGDIHQVTGAIVSSVVPPMTAAAAGAIKRLAGVTPMILGPGLKTGMNILAEIHNQLGSDIVASSVAALQKYPAPIIVVDMGTATTVSYLGKNTYEGCVIMPGVRIAVEALSGRAAALPHISIEDPPSVLARNTIDCMQAAKPAATIVMTGGNADAILKHCRHKIVYDENLLLDGLYYLYQKNRRKRKGE